MTTHQVNNLLSHAAYACMVAGTALVASDMAVGWVVRMGADVLFAILGARLGINAIVVWSSLFLLVDAYGGIW